MMKRRGWVQGHEIETYKSLIQVGLFALKFLQIINGGAAIALLAYLGNVAGAGRSAPNLTWPMALFIVGLLTAGATTITVYLTQLSLYNEDTGWRADGQHATWLRWSVGLALLSLVSFGAGALTATRSFVQ